MRGSSSSGCNGAKGTPIFYVETQKVETRDNERTLASKQEKEQKDTYHQQEMKLG
jgi:hypothetical protein